jgi:hypothetical protein
MRRAVFAPSLLAMFAFLTSGFAHAQAPVPPPAPAPTAPPAAPSAQPPASPPPAAPPPAAPAPGTAPAAPAEPTPPAPTEPAKTETPATDAKPAEPAAAPVPGVPAADQAQAQQKPMPAEPKDDLARPGYIPGYRRYPWLGPPPHIPHSASAFGNTAIPYGAPGPADVWNFNYSGFFAAGVRAVIRERPLPPGSERNSTALRNAVTTGEPFAAGGTQGSWVQMTFEYGNRVATAHVTIDTWNPSRGASFTQLGSQNFIDSAYMTFRIPPIDKLRLGLSVGAFSQTYGNLGQYGGGFYANAAGQVHGMGSTISAEYDLTDTIVVTGDYGIMGNDKAPGGCDVPPTSGSGVLPCPPGTPVAPGNLGDSYDPAAWVQHFHLGVIKNGDITLQGQLHYLQNWSQDDRGLLPKTRPPTTGSLSSYDPDPRPETPYVDESLVRGDGRYDAYGATIGFRGGQWFRGGVGLVYAHAENAYALHGLNVSYVGDGETFSRDWIGPRSVDSNGDIVGDLWTGAAEAEFSWGTLWRLPEPFWGEGFNVTTGFGFQYGVIGSHDPTRDGWKMYRAGIDTQVSILSWLGSYVRIDQVNPNLDQPEQTFYALTARLVFRTWWNSHESVALQYNKWIYGDEVPINFRAPPSEKLDTDALSLGFGMWW